MIRAARPGDLAHLVGLNREVQQLHLAAHPERYRDPPAGEIEVHLRALLEDPEVRIVVAEADGELVGYAVVRRIENAGNTFAQPRIVAHVDQLGVTAAARRGGHGRALMAAAEEQARTWGAVAVTLDVQAFNAGATGFYRALGYATATFRLAKPI